MSPFELPGPSQSLWNASAKTVSGAMSPAGPWHVPVGCGKSSQDESAATATSVLNTYERGRKRGINCDISYRRRKRSGVSPSLPCRARKCVVTFPRDFFSTRKPGEIPTSADAEKLQCASILAAQRDVEHAVLRIRQLRVP